MVIHEKVHDLSGAGKWDINTTRYVPIYGGSRSRLPIADDPEYRRYPGFVGIDEHLTADLYRIALLYQYMGGSAPVEEGEGSFTAMILGQTMDRLEAEAAEGDDHPAL